MKNKIARSMIAFGVSGIMLAANVVCFPMSAQAHSRCADTWVGQLDTDKIETNITCPLLSEQGQQIYISKSENKYQIPIYLEVDAAAQWEMQVVSNHPDFLEAVLSAPQNSEEETAEKLPDKYLNISIKYPEIEEEDIPTEESPGTEDDTLTEDDNPVEESTVSEVEIITVGAAISEEVESPTEETEPPTEETEPPTEETEPPTEETEPPTDETEPPTDETEPPTEETEPPTDETEPPTEEAEPPTEEEDTETEEETTTDPVVIPEYVSAEVTLTCADKTFKGTFIFPMGVTEEETIYTGDLLTCPSTYHPESKISLINGDAVTEVSCNGGNFPAMTAYELNGTEKVVLYDGGTMKLPANAAVQLDLSQTELNAQTPKDIVLATATKTYTLSYMSEPVFQDTKAPYILSEKDMILPVTYKLGEIEPTVVLEHLTIEGAELMWEPAEGIAYGESEDGTFRFAAKGASAGTYRVSIIWNDNNLPVYILKTAFFIQYEELGQGGTK